MDDEFFNGIASKAKVMKDISQTARDITNENAHFVPDALAEITPIFSAYGKKLEALGYKVVIKEQPEAMSMLLGWADGQSALFTVGRKSETTQLEQNLETSYFSLLRNEVVDTTPKDRRDWSAADFEKDLKSFITWFTDEAMVHGGI